MDPQTAGIALPVFLLIVALVFEVVDFTMIGKSTTPYQPRDATTI